MAVNGELFQRRSRITATTATIWTTIFSLPSSLASMVKPSEAAMERKPLTRNSRPMTHRRQSSGNQRGLSWAKVTKAAAMRSLSASGSSRMPIVVICSRFRAK